MAAQEGIGISDVLLFLQREFSSFARERAKWQEERAQLQARVAFLEGQRHGDANVKRDLLRRIKMLELALRRERAKNGGQPLPDDASTKLKEAKEVASQAEERKTRLREGREVLLTYLQELKYTDDLIKDQAARMAVKVDNWPPPALRSDHAAPGTDAVSEGPNGSSVPAMASDGSDEDDEEAEVLQALSDLGTEDDGQEASVDDDEDEAELLEGLEEMTRIAEGESSSARKEIVLEESTADASGDSEDDPFADVDDAALQASIQRRMASSKGKVRLNLGKAKHGGKSKKRGVLNVDFSGLGGESSSDDAEAASDKPPKSLESLFGMGADKSELGELADFTVNEPAPATDEASSSDTLTQRWRLRFVLKSHLDDVTCLSFLDDGSQSKEVKLFTGSRDGVVRFWNIPAPKKSLVSNLVPRLSLRGHFAGVTALALCDDLDCIVSADEAGKLVFWKLPPSDIEPNSPYDPAYQMASVDAHEGAIVALDYDTATSLLLSASSDGSCRLWNASSRECVCTVQSNSGEGPDIPTAASFLPSLSDSSSETVYFLVCYESGQNSIFTSTGSHVRDLAGMTTKPENSEDDDDEGSEDIDSSNDTASPFALCVASHADTSDIVLGCSDHKLRFFDVESGAYLSDMVAHQDAVKTLSIDANGMLLLSGGHDRSLRQWDLESKKCVYETSAHRVGKHGAILSCAWHPSKASFASGGSDGSVRVFSMQ